MFPIILLSLILKISSGLSEEVTIVTIPNGKIMGRKEVSATNVTFYAFQEIPYGKPPIGKLRFMAPEPVENWQGILDARTNEKMCYQGDSTYVETEDCLYVNVYTPVDINGNNASLPVIFYIYGGGFVIGSALYNNTGPHYFMEQNVVVVTVNYRVGAFGFISTGDTVIPGNYGLKDQTLALKWVQENIKYFGGDPDKVTIFGHSAGAAAVTFHTMSTQSSGLFRAAISQSGSALCPWAYQRHHKKIAYSLASFIDSSFNPNATSEELLEFLQSVTAEDIIKNSNTFPEGPGHEELVQGFWFTPVVEPEHETAFLTEEIYASIENGVANPVPLLTGICSEEQVSKGENQDNFKIELQEYEKNISLLVNENMHLIDPESLTEAGNAIHKIYTDKLLPDDLAAAVKYFSDMSFSRSIIHQAKLQSRYSDVYFYQFSHYGPMGVYDVYVEGADRVTHTEDVFYMWTRNNNSDLDANTPIDILTSKRYVTLFANFAKTLNPTPEPSNLFDNIIWPKVNPDNFQYLNINDTLEIRMNPKEKAYKGWVEVYEKLAIKPYDTF